MSTRVLALAALSLVFDGLFLGQERTLDRSLSCVASLELPTQGLLAARARSSGTVTALVRVGGEGHSSALELTGVDDLLKGEVRVALNLSRFAPECRGRSVQIVYAFTLEDPPTDS